MRGNPVGVESAALRSPIQKRSTMTIANPRLPLRRIEKHMLCGITIDAFSISSASLYVSKSGSQKKKKKTHGLYLYGSPHRFLQYISFEKYLRASLSTYQGKNTCLSLTPQRTT